MKAEDFMYKRGDVWYARFPVKKTEDQLIARTKTMPF